MTTKTKTRTITLTGRPPVRIREAEWPICASAEGDSYGGSDYGRYQQALGQGECDEYSIRVRQHADGRTLIYGVLSAARPCWGQPAGGESHRGGVLLAAPSADAPGRWTWEGTIGDAPVTIVIWPAIAETIRQIGEECGIPDATIRACIADLPAEDI
jgi:hypothetical protein